MKKLVKGRRLSLQAIGLSLAIMACNLISDQTPAGEGDGVGRATLIPAASGGAASSDDDRFRHRIFGNRLNGFFIFFRRKSL